ncbi:hypothetical protein IFO68_21250 [Photobacterium sp. CAU 1568]|uniref:Condensation domain-containing protein n=2 Tax=Photobacterium arenosum TaxID=2774143 RepID=A0ABR9BRM9_9GAMM|nr:condensation domain-containing protein [Photobacterium arenosum]MBD8515208.1 hypothetical protein [Photobacterium arenosum]
MNLTVLQRRMWWLNELNPKAAGFNIPVLLESSTEPSTDWLENLTSTIVSLNVANYVLKDSPRLAWEKILTNTFAIDRIANDSGCIETILTRLARHHFDLRKEPPLKVTLVKTKTKTYLMFVFCHIVFDGSAAAMFINSLAKTTQNELTYLTGAKTQPVDTQSSSTERNGFEHWMEQFANLEQGLLSDYKTTDDEVAIFDIPDQLLTKSRGFCRRQKISLSTLLLSVWAEWLLRQLSQPFVTIGTAFENRNATQKRYALDLYVSIYPLVISNASIDQLELQLETAKQMPQVPYEQLAETEAYSDVKRWFDCFYGFHHWPKSELNIQGSTWSICAFTQGISRYPLSFDVFLLGKRGLFKIEKNINILGLEARDIYEQLLEILKNKIKS